MNKRRKYIWSAAMAVLLMSLTGCSRVQEQSGMFYALDTQISVRAWAGSDSHVLADTEELVRQLEAELSISDENSFISRLNAHPGESVELTDEEASLLRQTLELCQQTEGALNIALTPVSMAWGFHTGNYRIPSEEERKELLAYTDFQKIRLEGDTAELPEHMMIDLGAVGKGYVSDRCAEYLKSQGVDRGILELGGNVYCLGKKQDGSLWKVGIQDPFHPEEQAFACIVSASNESVVTSGNYQRYFTGEDGKKYHHIMDGSTGAPAESGLMSVTIITENGFKADAYSTALFVMGYERGKAFYEQYMSEDCQVIWITEDGRLYYTKGLAGRIETGGSIPAQEAE